MVDRFTVDDLIYEEIKSSLTDSSYIDSSTDVFLWGADGVDEARPRVVYQTTIQKRDYNAASNGIYGYITNNDDEVISEVYREYIANTFDIHAMVAQDSNSYTVVQDIYEDIRSHFLEYEKRIKNPRDVHSDINDIYVDAADRDDNPALDPVQRFETIPVVVEFYREVTEDGEPIQQVVSTIEGVDFTTTTS